MYTIASALMYERPRSAFTDLLFDSPLLGNGTPALLEGAPLATLATPYRCERHLHEVESTVPSYGILKSLSPTEYLYMLHHLSRNSCAIRSCSYCRDHRRFWVPA